MRELTKLEEVTCKATDKINVILHALTGKKELLLTEVEELDKVLSEIRQELNDGLNSVHIYGR